MAETRSRPRSTVEDFLALGEGVLAELIDGELYLNPAPAPRHQDVVLALGMHLRAFTDTRHLGRAYISPIDVYLPSGDVVQPDVIFIRKDRMDIIQDAIRGVADLAIEVISPSRPERDRFIKKQLFAANGVPEYWIVDPAARSVEVFALEGEAYAPAGWFTGDATVVNRSLPGLEIPLSTLFRPD